MELISSTEFFPWSAFCDNSANTKCILPETSSDEENKTLSQEEEEEVIVISG